MNRPFTKIATLLLLTAASLTACKKDKDEEKEKSRTDLLTQKAWLYVDYGKDDNKDGVLSKDESSVEACEVDDSFIFNADGTLIEHDNTTRCGSSEPESHTITWAFQNNETELVISTGRIIKIKTLNETTFECTSEEIGYPDQPKIITIFKH
jgi:lipocalin-like protein